MTDEERSALQRQLQDIGFGSETIAGLNDRQLKNAVEVNIKQREKEMQALREAEATKALRKPRRKGGPINKLKKGGFPDLTGDGQVTQADILKGRGVKLAKGGMKKKRNANIDYRKSGMFYVGGMASKITPINRGKK